MAEQQQRYYGEANERRLVWDSGYFVGKIIAAARGRAITKAEFPNTIDLEGPLANVCRQMYADSIANDGQEVSKLGISRVGSNDLYIPPDDYKGKLTVSIYHELKPTEHNTLLLHTHGILETPPSLDDLIDILVPNNPGEEPTIGQIVLARQSRFLIVRHEGSALLTEEQADQFLQDQLDRHIERNKLTAERTVRSGLPFRKNKRIDQFQQDHELQHWMTTLLTACHEADLQVYSCIAVGDMADNYVFKKTM